MEGSAPFRSSSPAWREVCSSTLCQGESPLCGRTARIPRVAALWAREGEGSGLRSSSGVGECSQTPDHVEDILLAQMTKLAQRWERCAGYMPKCDIWQSWLALLMISFQLELLVWVNSLQGENGGDRITVGNAVLSGFGSHRGKDWAEPASGLHSKGPSKNNLGFQGWAVEEKVEKLVWLLYLRCSWLSKRERSLESLIRGLSKKSATGPLAKTGCEKTQTYHLISGGSVPNKLKLPSTPPWKKLQSEERTTRPAGTVWHLHTTGADKEGKRRTLSPLLMALCRAQFSNQEKRMDLCSIFSFENVQQLLPQENAPPTHNNFEQMQLVQTPSLEPMEQVLSLKRKLKISSLNMSKIHSLNEWILK